jgi:hypothetical protein
VVSDYFCYGQKVKEDGYLCFHDASPQAQGKDWQRMGDENDFDMRISVLKALNHIGLLNPESCERLGWKKAFYKWDAKDEAGGMIVFRKLKKSISYA